MSDAERMTDHFSAVDLEVGQPFKFTSDHPLEGWVVAPVPPELRRLATIRVTPLEPQPTTTEEIYSRDPLLRAGLWLKRHKFGADVHRVVFQVPSEGSAPMVWKDGYVRLSDLGKPREQLQPLQTQAQSEGKLELVSLYNVALTLTSVEGA